MASRAGERLDAEASWPGRWPAVSIIVVNWNTWALTVECLESLRRLTYPSYEVVVVDNGSTDGSVNHIRAWAAGDLTVESRYLPRRAAGGSVALREIGLAEAASGEERPDAPAPFTRGVTVIKVGENRGFTGGNNIGMRYALRRGAQWVFLLNSDAVADPDALSAMVTAAQAPGVGMVAPAVLTYADPKVVDRLGIVLTKGGLPYERRQEGDGPLLCPDGCAALYSRALLGAVECNGQYFDEDFFAYGEDVDLGIRARFRGFGAVLARNAVVYHKIGGSQGGPLSPMSVYLRHRNTIWTIAKNYPRAALWADALWILQAQIATLAWNVLGPAWKPVLRGKLDGMWGIGKMWRKRPGGLAGVSPADLPRDPRVFLPARRRHQPFTRSPRRQTPARVDAPNL